MIKGIIFDLDGTLLDTVADINRELNKALNKFDYDSIDHEETRKFLGNGSRTLVKEALKQTVDTKTLDEVSSYYITNYSKPEANILTRPYEGIIDMLNKLQQIGIKTAITSNKMDVAVKELNVKVFNGLFDIALGESEKTPLKPDPTMLYQALELMGLRKEEVLFIGDTEVDLQAATNANLDSVAVTWGFRTKEFLTSLNPNYIIDEPRQLIEIIKKD